MVLPTCMRMASSDILHVWRCVVLLFGIGVCTPSIKNGVGVLQHVIITMLSFFARGGVNRA